LKGDEYRVKIGEFIDTYCKDIVEKAKKVKEVLDDLDFSYDAVVEGQDGEKIKVIYAEDQTEIPIQDILSLSDLDFRRTYHGTSSYEAYKSYLSNFIILEGEEVLNQIRNEIQRSREKIERYSALDVDSMLSPFSTE
jgi:hypothetical protein